MESEILNALGKAASLGGIAFGVFLLLFQGVLQKRFLPQAGLGSAQAFAVILSLMILTFGIAGIGVVAWLISLTITPEAPIPGGTLNLLAGLIGLVLASALYIGARAKPDPNVVLGAATIEQIETAVRAKSPKLTPTQIDQFIQALRELRGDPSFERAVEEARRGNSHVAE